MIVTERPIHPSVETLRIDRPEKRNALDATVVLELTAAVKRAGADDSVRAIVLTGTGKAFSAGADLAALEALASASFEENLADSRLLADLFESIYRLEKPIIARVNGHAIAGGCGLATVCDLIVADERAKFGFTEAKIGFVPAIISVYLLERHAESVLRASFLTGTLFTAHRAVAMGLADRAVQAGELDDTVRDLARDLVRGASSGAIATTKSLLRERHAHSHADRLEMAVRLNAETRGTAACRAGVRAFLEKAAYPWTSDWDTSD